MEYTSPNQFVIETNRLSKCDNKEEENYYTKINLKALEIAQRNLSANAFKFYMYLAKNKEGYIMALSRAATTAYCGFSEGTYHKCFNELKEHRYLIQSKQQSNKYNFYDIPLEEDNIFVECHKNGFDF